MHLITCIQIIHTFYMVHILYNLVNYVLVVRKITQEYLSLNHVNIHVVSLVLTTFMLEGNITVV